MADSLDNFALTRQSPVLEEKLADLLTRLGKPASTVHALQQALELDPSPQQRVRVSLSLADQLVTLQREPEAFEVYRQFLEEVPGYPDKIAIYQKLGDLAEKLGRKDDAEKSDREIKSASPP